MGAVQTMAGSLQPAPQWGIQREALLSLKSGGLSGAWAEGAPSYPARMWTDRHLQEARMLSPQTAPCAAKTFQGPIKGALQQTQAVLSHFFNTVAKWTVGTLGCPAGSS